MKRTRLLVLLLGIAGPICVNGQAAEPAFEVASVRPAAVSNQPFGRVSILKWEPERFVAQRITMIALIGEAYDVPQRLIDGGPQWIKSEEFDITATYSNRVGRDERLAMLRAFLRDRFGLMLRRQIRDAQVYELVLARDDGRVGPRLRRPDDTVDCEAVLSARRKASPVGPNYAARGLASVLENGPDLTGPVCDSDAVYRGLPGGGYARSWWASRKPMSYLAEYLSSVAERPVLDHTGLRGEFDMVLEHSPQPLTTPPTDQPSSDIQIRNIGPSLFIALEEQLGLTLRSTRGPVEFFVIDSVQRPTPN
jgi:uncharacterized protein (TIGR03435 family)